MTLVSREPKHIVGFSVCLLRKHGCCRPPSCGYMMLPKANLQKTASYSWFCTWSWS